MISQTISQTLTVANPTDAIFVSINEAGVEAPIPVLEKASIGTQSQYKKEPSEVSAHGNPKRIEATALAPEVSILSIRFGLTVTGSALKPHACDVPRFRHNIIQFSKLYGAADGYLTIARRIAYNIANGRWAWKNRIFATEFVTTVQVTHPVKETLTFASLSYPLSNFPKKFDKNTEKLAAIIASALSGAGVARFKIDGYLDVGPGAIVFPSQEFADKDDNDDEYGVKKILYGIAAMGISRCAAFHEQKIGNALRTIDTWHAGQTSSDVDVVSPGEPIPVNPYGQHREGHVVVRQKRDAHSGSGNPSLYQLMKDELPVILAELAAGKVTDDAHFLAANLIRGGVFGFGEKVEKKKKEAADPSTASEPPNGSPDGFAPPTAAKPGAKA